MGGKAKMLDGRQLESIYAASRRFEHQAGSSMQTIHQELTKLNDPAMQSSLSGERGETAKTAIARFGLAIEVLKETLQSTSKFIDAKLAGAAQLSKDKELAAADSGPGHLFASDKRLRK